ncbi:unnamed protein product [Pylaiella littoralis]
MSGAAAAGAAAIHGHDNDSAFWLYGDGDGDGGGGGVAGCSGEIGGMSTTVDGGLLGQYEIGHDNIARVLDVFEDATFYFFVLELVSGGEMFEHLTRNGPYSEATAAGFMRELAAALQFLHSEEIIHADLKPENLMLSSWDLGDSKLKVVDFGSSLRTGTPIDLSNCTLGTTWYLPPEAVWEKTTPSPSPTPNFSGGGDGGGGGGGGGGVEVGKGEHELRAAPALDMWSVGCILFIMLCGAHPFDLESNSSEADVVKRVKAGVVPLGELGSGVSDSAKDLISRLLTRNPRERLTAEGMMRHPWIQGGTAPARPLKGSDARLARFRELLSQKLETGIVSLLVREAVAEGNNRPDEYTFNPYGGGQINASTAYTKNSGHSNSNSNRNNSSTNGSAGNKDGGGDGGDAQGSPGVVEGVDVVKNAYRAFDRQGKGRVSAKDIAGVLEEHSATVSDAERRAIDEAVAVAREFRRPSGKKRPLEHNARRRTPDAATNADSSSSSNIVATTDGATSASERPNGSARAPPTPGKTSGEEEAEIASTPSAAAEVAAAAAAAAAAVGAAGSTAAAAAAAASAAVASSAWSSASSLLGAELRATAAVGAPPESAMAATAATAAAAAAAAGGGEEDGLDMSDFEDLLLGHLKTSEYPAGEFVFREGDAPDGGLYFIVEGRVDVLVDSAGWNSEGVGTTGLSSPDSDSTDSHTRVASMGPGDFFGEGGVVSSQPRGESVRAATPVKVINVSLASCHRMIDAPGKVSSSLRRVALSRALFRAKNVVRAVNSVTTRRLGPGETVFRQGEAGLSLFTVDEGELDVVKEHSGVRRTVARLSPGSFFGEMALMTAQPRSASVVCAADCGGGGCVVEEISGDDFARLLMARRTGFRRDVMRMLRARQFRHGVYKLLTELGSEATFSDQELRQVFDRADTTRSGTLSLAELKAALCRADPLLHDSAAEEIMAILDLEATGCVSFEEFLKIIRWDP